MMKIGIFGAGPIGSTLARKFVAAGPQGPPAGCPSPVAVLKGGRLRAAAFSVAVIKSGSQQGRQPLDLYPTCAGALKFNESG